MLGSGTGEAREEEGRLRPPEVQIIDSQQWHRLQYVLVESLYLVLWGPPLSSGHPFLLETGGAQGGMQITTKKVLM